MNFERRATNSKFIKMMISCLSEDLLKPSQRKKLKAGSHPTTGHCYILSELFWHFLGGKGCGYVPQVLKWEGNTHWYLKGSKNKILDLSAEQFKTPPDYSKGKGCGFLTKKPSKRARVLFERMEQAWLKQRILVPTRISAQLKGTLDIPPKGVL